MQTELVRGWWKGGSGSNGEEIHLKLSLLNRRRIKDLKETEQK